MKIIALPDLHHGGIRRLPDLADDLRAADLVLLPGDLTNGGGAAQAAEVVDAVRAYNPAILAVPGNWDNRQAMAYLDGQGINLHGRQTLVDGVAIIGAGGALPGPLNKGTIFSEIQFEQFLEEAAAGLDPARPAILMCHQPPRRTRADRTFLGLHVGSRAVRQFIERHQPLICFSGHIHEGLGLDRIGRTQIANPGPLLQGRYAYAEVVSGRVENVVIRPIP